MRKLDRRGQSILEYTLLLGAIIAIVVAVLLGQGGIKDKVNVTYNKFGQAIENTSNDLSTGVFQ